VPDRHIHQHFPTPSHTIAGLSEVDCVDRWWDWCGVGLYGECVSTDSALSGAVSRQRDSAAAQCQ